MKKSKKGIYAIGVTLVIIVIAFLIYQVVAKTGEDENKQIRQKALTEVQFMENKLVNLFNKMNEIQFENYKISVEKIEGSSNEQSEGSSQNQEQSSQGENSKSSSGSESGSDSSSSEDKQSSSSSQKETKKYSLNQSGILIDDKNIDWNQIKTEIETLYVSLPTITLDLYQTTTNPNDVLTLNDEFDNLTKVVKEEKKEDVLAQLSIVYDLIPNFIDNCSDDVSEKIISRTKAYIFKAYSQLDKQDWGLISNSISSATQEFSRLLTEVNGIKQKEFNHNKAYIMLNEMQNAVQKQDSDIFLIKYKNLLEDLSNL